MSQSRRFTLTWASAGAVIVPASYLSQFGGALRFLMFILAATAMTLGGWVSARSIVGQGAGSRKGRRQIARATAAWFLAALFGLTSALWLSASFESASEEPHQVVYSQQGRQGSTHTGLPGFVGLCLGVGMAGSLGALSTSMFTTQRYPLAHALCGFLGFTIAAYLAILGIALLVQPIKIIDSPQLTVGIGGFSLRPPQLRKIMAESA